MFLIGEMSLWNLGINERSGFNISLVVASHRLHTPGATTPHTYLGVLGEEGGALILAYSSRLPTGVPWSTSPCISGQDFLKHRNAVVYLRHFILSTGLGTSRPRPLSFAAW